jgi:hypothetical protein
MVSYKPRWSWLPSWYLSFRFRKISKTVRLIIVTFNACAWSFRQSAVEKGNRGSRPGHSSSLIMKIVSSLEKLPEERLYPSVPSPGAVTSHTLSPSVTWKTEFHVNSRFVTSQHCPKKPRFFLSSYIRCSIKLNLNGMCKDEGDVVPYYF